MEFTALKMITLLLLSLLAVQMSFCLPKSHQILKNYLSKNAGRQQQHKIETMYSLHSKNHRSLRRIARSTLLSDLSFLSPSSSLDKQPKFDMFQMIAAEKLKKMQNGISEFEAFIDCDSTFAQQSEPAGNQLFYIIFDAQVNAIKKSLAYLENLPNLSDELRTAIDKLDEQYDSFVTKVEKCIPRSIHQ